MQNVAVIFAGGTGKRMNTRSKPKQFLELHGKPILIYTLEQFQQNDAIDAIIIVMLDTFIELCSKLVDKYAINKVTAIVPGGETGQKSIYNGIAKAHELFSDDAIVLIHDGVRPLIDQETINKCLECAKNNGTAITVSPATETVTIKGNNNTVEEVIDRSKCQLAKAPQCFRLKDIYNAHRKSIEEGKDDFIDSASMMQHYGYDLHTVEGNSENIKITTPGDFYIFRAIVDARENSQIFGI